MEVVSRFSVDETIRWKFTTDTNNASILKQSVTEEYELIAENSLSLRRTDYALAGALSASPLSMSG